MARVKYDIPPLGGMKIDIPSNLLQRHFLPWASGVWPLNGKVCRIPGKQKKSATQVSGAVMLIYEYATETGDSHLLVISEDKAYKFNTTTYALDSIHDATDFTGGQSNPFSAATFYDGSGNEIAIIANLRDAIRKWTGSGTIAALGGTPPKGKLLCVFSNYLVVGHTEESGTEYPRRIRWSALANGESWPAENYADLRKTTDWLVSLRLLRDRCVAYKEKSISILDHVGGGLTFSLDENVINGVGPLNDAVVVAYSVNEDRHFFIGNDLNIYAFDGIACTPVARNIRDRLVNIEPQYKLRASGIADREDRKVIWAVPYGTDETCKDLIILDVDDMSWWIKEAEPIAISSIGQAKLEQTYTWDTLPYDTWDEWDDPGGWNSRQLLLNAPEILFGGVDGYIRKWIGGVDDDGSNLPSKVNYPFDNLDGDDETQKLVTKIIVEMENTGAGEITLKAFVDENDADAVALDEDGNTTKTVYLYGDDANKKMIYQDIDVAVMGYSFSWQFSSTGQAWSGRVLAVDYRVIGRQRV